ncbi:haloalkane dehalogenase [Tateyamaria sp. SN6-1]|uniref:haloalkane dehalogenase n=1 Tax=Tateyamaria sp. SN6-1 TaxID=3092148 RepID=UPI0039F56C57
MLKTILALGTTALISAITLSGGAIAQQTPDFGCAPEPASAEVRYESKFVEVLGANMHYYEAGPSDRPVVLLLHGLPVSAYFWRNVMPHLESNSRVIALDHIGFGKSDRPAGFDYSLQDHIDHIGGFVDALGLEDIVVVGQDLGSMSGMIWAQQNAEKIRAVAFVEGLIPPLLPVRAETTPEQLLGIWQATRNPPMAQQMFVDGNFFIDQALPSLTACPMADEVMATYAASWSDPDDRPILFATPAELPIDGQPPKYEPTIAAYVEWLTTATTPKLLVQATPGVLMPEALVKQAAQMMPNSAVAEIGGGLHFLAESKPDALGEALNNWINELPSN